MGYYTRAKLIVREMPGLYADVRVIEEAALDVVQYIKPESQAILTQEKISWWRWEFKGVLEDKVVEHILEVSSKPKNENVEFIIHGEGESPDDVWRINVMRNKWKRYVPENVLGFLSEYENKSDALFQARCKEAIPPVEYNKLVW
ncbi:MAG: hypothetical protein WBF90_33860 [Rivularia sp. (in: cyanobacteria)]